MFEATLVYIEFQDSQSYTEKPYLKQTNKQTKKNRRKRNKRRREGERQTDRKKKRKVPLKKFRVQENLLSMYKTDLLSP